MFQHRLINRAARRIPNQPTTKVKLTIHSSQEQSVCYITQQPILQPIASLKKISPRPTKPTPLPTNTRLYSQHTRLVNKITCSNHLNDKKNCNLNHSTAPKLRPLRSTTIPLLTRSNHLPHAPNNTRSPKSRTIPRPNPEKLLLGASPMYWDNLQLQPFFDFIVQANPRDIYSNHPVPPNSLNIPPSMVEHPRAHMYRIISSRTRFGEIVESICRIFGQVIKALVVVFKITPLRALYPMLESYIEKSRLYYHIDKWLFLTPNERLYAAYLNYKLQLLYGRLIAMAKMFVGTLGEHQFTVEKSPLLIENFDQKHHNDQLLLIEYDLTKTNPEYQTYKALLDDFNATLLDIQLSQRNSDQETLDLLAPLLSPMKDVPTTTSNHTPSLLVPLQGPHGHLHQQDENLKPFLVDENHTPLSKNEKRNFHNGQTDERNDQNISNHLSPSKLRLVRKLSPRLLTKLDLLSTSIKISPFVLDPVTSLPVWREWEPDWTELGALDPFGEDLLPDYDPALWTRNPSQPGQIVLRSSLWKESFGMLTSTIENVREALSTNENSPLLYREGSSARTFHYKNIMFPRVPELLHLATTDPIQYQLYRDGYPFMESDVRTESFDSDNDENNKKDKNENGNPNTTTATTLKSKQFKQTHYGLQDILMLEAVPCDVVNITLRHIARKLALNQILIEKAQNFETNGLSRFQSIIKRQNDDFIQHKYDQYDQIMKDAYQKERQVNNNDDKITEEITQLLLNNPNLDTNFITLMRSKSPTPSDAFISSRRLFSPEELLALPDLPRTSKDRIFLLERKQLLRSLEKYFLINEMNPQQVPLTKTPLSALLATWASQRGLFTPLGRYIDRGQGVIDQAVRDNALLTTMSSIIDDQNDFQTSQKPPNSQKSPQSSPRSPATLAQPTPIRTDSLSLAGVNVVIPPVLRKAYRIKTKHEFPTPLDPVENIMYFGNNITNAFLQYDYNQAQAMVGLRRLRWDNGNGDGSGSERSLKDGDGVERIKRRENEMASGHFIINRENDYELPPSLTNPNGINASVMKRYTTSPSLERDDNDYLNNNKGMRPQSTHSSEEMRQLRRGSEEAKSTIRELRSKMTNIGLNPDDIYDPSSPLAPRPDDDAYFTPEGNIVTWSELQEYLAERDRHRSQNLQNSSQNPSQNQNQLKGHKKSFFETIIDEDGDGDDDDLNVRNLRSSSLKTAPNGSSDPRYNQYPNPNNTNNPQTSSTDQFDPKSFTEHDLDAFSRQLDTKSPYFFQKYALAQQLEAQRRQERRDNEELVPGVHGWNEMQKKEQEKRETTARLRRQQWALDSDATQTPLKHRISLAEYLDPVDGEFRTQSAALRHVLAKNRPNLTETFSNAAVFQDFLDALRVRLYPHISDESFDLYSSIRSLKSLANPVARAGIEEAGKVYKYDKTLVLEEEYKNGFFDGVSYPRIDNNQLLSQNDDPLQYLLDGLRGGTVGLNRRELEREEEDFARRRLELEKSRKEWLDLYYEDQFDKEQQSQLGQYSQYVKPANPTKRRTADEIINSYNVSKKDQNDDQNDQSGHSDQKEDTSRAKKAAYTMAVPKIPDTPISKLPQFLQTGSEGLAGGGVPVTPYDVQIAKLDREQIESTSFKRGLLRTMSLRPRVVENTLSQGYRDDYDADVRLHNQLKSIHQKAHGGENNHDDDDDDVFSNHQQRQYRLRNNDKKSNGGSRPGNQEKQYYDSDHYINQLHSKPELVQDEGSPLYNTIGEWSQRDLEEANRSVNDRENKRDDGGQSEETMTKKVLIPPYLRSSKETFGQPPLPPTQPTAPLPIKRQFDSTNLPEERNQREFSRNNSSNENNNNNNNTSKNNPHIPKSDYIAQYRRRDTFNQLRPLASIFHQIEQDQITQDINIFSNPPVDILTQPQAARLQWILEPLYDMTPRELVDVYDLLSTHQAAMTILPFDPYSHYEYLIYQHRKEQIEHFQHFGSKLNPVTLQTIIDGVSVMDIQRDLDRYNNYALGPRDSDDNDEDDEDWGIGDGASGDDESWAIGAGASRDANGEFGLALDETDDMRPITQSDLMQLGQGDDEELKRRIKLRLRSKRHEMLGVRQEVEAVNRKENNRVGIRFRRKDQNSLKKTPLSTLATLPRADGNISFKRYSQPKNFKLGKANMGRDSDTERVNQMQMVMKLSQRNVEQRNLHYRSKLYQLHQKLLNKQHLQDKIQSELDEYYVNHGHSIYHTTPISSLLGEYERHIGMLSSIDTLLLKNNNSSTKVLTAEQFSQLPSAQQQDHIDLLRALVESSQRDYSIIHNYDGEEMNIDLFKGLGRVSDVLMEKIQIFSTLQQIDNINRSTPLPSSPRDLEDGGDEDNDNKKGHFLFDRINEEGPSNSTRPLRNRMKPHRKYTREEAIHLKRQIVQNKVQQWIHRSQLIAGTIPLPPSRDDISSFAQLYTDIPLTPGSTKAFNHKVALNDETEKDLMQQHLAMITAATHLNEQSYIFEDHPSISFDQLTLYQSLIEKLSADASGKMKKRAKMMEEQAQRKKMRQEQRRGLNHRAMGSVLGPDGQIFEPFTLREIEEAKLILSVMPGGQNSNDSDGSNQGFMDLIVNKLTFFSPSTSSSADIKVVDRDGLRLAMVMRSQEDQESQSQNTGQNTGQNNNFVTAFGASSPKPSPDEHKKMAEMDLLFETISKMRLERTGSINKSPYNRNEAHEGGIDWETGLNRQTLVKMDDPNQAKKIKNLQSNQDYSDLDDGDDNNDDATFIKVDGKWVQQNVPNRTSSKKKRLQKSHDFDNDYTSDQEELEEYTGRLQNLRQHSGADEEYNNRMALNAFEHEKDQYFGLDGQYTRRQIMRQLEHQKRVTESQSKLERWKKTSRGLFGSMSVGVELPTSRHDHSALDADPRNESPPLDNDDDVIGVGFEQSGFYNNGDHYNENGFDSDSLGQQLNALQFHTIYPPTLPNEGITPRQLFYHHLLRTMSHLKLVDGNKVVIKDNMVVGVLDENDNNFNDSLATNLSSPSTDFSSIAIPLPNPFHSNATKIDPRNPPGGLLSSSPSYTSSPFHNDNNNNNNGNKEIVETPSTLLNISNLIYDWNQYLYHGNPVTSPLYKLLSMGTGTGYVIKPQYWLEFMLKSTQIRFSMVKEALFPTQQDPIAYGQDIASLNSTPKEMIMQRWDELQEDLNIRYPSHLPSDNAYLNYYNQHSHHFLYSVMQKMMEVHFLHMFSSYFIPHRDFVHSTTLLALPPLLLSTTPQFQCFDNGPGEDYDATDVLSNALDVTMGELLTTTSTAPTARGSSNSSSSSAQPVYRHNIRFPTGDPRYFRYMQVSKGKDPVTSYLTYFKEQLFKDYDYYSTQDQTFLSQYSTLIDELLDADHDTRDDNKKNERIPLFPTDSFGISTHGEHLLNLLELIGSDDRPLNPAAIQQVELAMPFLSQFMGVKQEELLQHIHFTQQTNKHYLLLLLISIIRNHVDAIRSDPVMINSSLTGPIMKPIAAPPSFPCNTQSDKSHTDNNIKSNGKNNNDDPGSANQSSNNNTHDNKDLSPQAHYIHTLLTPDLHHPNGLSLLINKSNHFKALSQLRSKQFMWLTLDDIFALDQFSEKVLNVSQRGVDLYRNNFKFNDGGVMPSVYYNSPNPITSTLSIISPKLSSGFTRLTNLFGSIHTCWPVSEIVKSPPQNPFDGLPWERKRNYHDNVILSIGTMENNYTTAFSHHSALIQPGIDDIGDQTRQYGNEVFQKMAHQLASPGQNVGKEDHHDRTQPESNSSIFIKPFITAGQMISNSFSWAIGRQNETDFNRGDTNRNELVMTIEEDGAETQKSSPPEQQTNPIPSSTYIAYSNIDPFIEAEIALLTSQIDPDIPFEFEQWDNRMGKM